MRNIFLIAVHFFTSFIFIFVFGFCGFMQRVSPNLLTRTSTAFWCWIFGVSVDIKCGILCREVGDGAVEEELADKPGTTNGT